MGRVLAQTTTSSTPTTVPIVGALGVTIADIFSVTVPPSRDYDLVKITAVVEMLTTGTSAAQAVNFDVRPNGATNATTADKDICIHHKSSNRPCC